jgi:alkylhydroperoxidase family enzyme
VEDPYAEKFQRLRDSVLTGPGVLPRDVRQALAEGRDVEVRLHRYADKVRRHAYKVVDEDIEGLYEVGYSEDDVFEATVSVALGTAIERLEAGLAATGER